MNEKPTISLDDLPVIASVTKRWPLSSSENDRVTQELAGNVQPTAISELTPGVSQDQIDDERDHAITHTDDALKASEANGASRNENPLYKGLTPEQVQIAKSIPVRIDRSVISGKPPEFYDNVLATARRAIVDAFLAPTIDENVLSDLAEAYKSAGRSGASFISVDGNAWPGLTLAAEMRTVILAGKDDKTHSASRVTRAGGARWILHNWLNPDKKYGVEKLLELNPDLNKKKPGEKSLEQAQDQGQDRAGQVDQARSLLGRLRGLVSRK